MSPVQKGDMLKRFLISICALALTSTLSVAQEQETTLPRREFGAHALSSLYFLSPDNPWHAFLMHEGEMPLALFTVKQHLITVDSSIEERFEGDQLLDSVLLAFAAYFKAYGETAWEKVQAHMEAACEQEDSLSKEDKESIMNDITLALEDYITEPYDNDVADLWVSVLAQIPWFLEGVPAYLIEHINPKVETETEVVIVDHETALTHQSTLQPVLQIAPPVCSETPEQEAHTCKKSLREIWNENIKPHLKKKYQKFKTEFDKVEREVREFRKEVVKDIKKEVKNFFKKL